MADKHSVKVTKSVERTIWTAKYEGLKVDVSLEETIEYKDEKERTQKMEELSSKLMQELILTINKACEELDIQEKRIFKAKDPVKDEIEVVSAAKVNKTIFDSL